MPADHEHLRKLGLLLLLTAGSKSHTISISRVGRGAGEAIQQLGAHLMHRLLVCGERLQASLYTQAEQWAQWLPGQANCCLGVRRAVRPKDPHCA